MQTITQHEKDFVVEFLADTLHGLTMNNVLTFHNVLNVIYISTQLSLFTFCVYTIIQS